LKIADYAVDGRQRIHRVLSGIVCLSLVLGIHLNWGFDAARRAAIVFGFATTGIWFAHAVVSERPSHSLAAPYLPSSVGAIRFVCWFVLLGVPFIVYLFSRL
jgi:hypothetical protein